MGLKNETEPRKAFIYPFTHDLLEGIKKMNRKKFAKYTGLFVATLMLLAISVNASFARAYPAQITAEGTTTLRGFKGQPDVDLTIKTNFTSMVPSNVPPDSYDNVEFRGFAIVPRQEIIKFEGLLTVKGYNFWVKFVAEKPTDQNITEGMYSAKGELTITISEITLPPLEITWVLMRGRITKYGENDAFGGLMAHAKISEINNWTRAHGFFTLQPPPIKTMPMNFSVSYFVVILANATKTEVNYNDKALYIEGDWNVYNRTCTVTVIDTTEVTVTISIKEIVKGAYGQLSATLEPSEFTLEITGMDTISGEVTFYHFKFARPSERGIPRSDFNRDRLVNILDIIRVAKAYGARHGLPNYDFDLDINFDFIINILDLAAAAQEFGGDY